MPHAAHLTKIKSSSLRESSRLPLVFHGPQIAHYTRLVSDFYDAANLYSFYQLKTSAKQVPAVRVCYNGPVPDQDTSQCLAMLA